jgi:DNA repair protein RadA/Sms
LPTDLITFGEIGLAGEIRPVPNGQERLREAAKHGFKHAIVPKANMPKKSEAIEGLDITPVQRVSELVDTSFS